MNKKLALLIIISTFLLTGCSIVSYQKSIEDHPTAKITNEPSINENTNCAEILKEAKKITSSMNYCQSHSECLIVKDYSLGCYYLMNKNADKTNVEKIIKQYSDAGCPDIMLDCYNNILTTSCYNNKCEING